MKGSNPDENTNVLTVRYGIVIYVSGTETTRVVLLVAASPSRPPVPGFEQRHLEFWLRACESAG